MKPRRKQERPAVESLEQKLLLSYTFHDLIITPVVARPPAETQLMTPSIPIPPP